MLLFFFLTQIWNIFIFWFEYNVEFILFVILRLKLYEEVDSTFSSGINILKYKLSTNRGYFVIRLCKEPNHVPLKCDEVKTDAARLYLEEKMTEALIRKCYNCGRTFFKEDGCNKMTCVCGALMCYICDKPVKGYDHFQGQGSMASNL